MSTIPLSAREGYGQTISGDDAPPPVIERDNGKLDALIDSAFETITTRGDIKEDDETLLPSIDGEGWATLSDLPEPTEREAGLEKVLRAREAVLAERETDSQDFHHAKEWRETLRHRYGGKVSLENVLENAVSWHQALVANPHLAADQLASNYLQNSPYAANLDDPPKKAAPADEHPNVKLSRIIEDAIDGKHHGDQREFKATAKQRAALKSMFPGMAFKDAMKSLIQFDRDMHVDPLTTAARMGAAYGMPVTAGQTAAFQARYEYQKPAWDAIEATVSYMPRYQEFEEDMIRVIGRKDFVRTPDMQQDLLRAYRIVELVREEQDSVRAQHAEKSKPKPRAGLDGLLDKAFAQHGIA